MNETLEHYKGLEPIFKAQMDSANRPKFIQEQQTDHKKTTQERYEHAADLFASAVSSVVAKNTATDPFYYFPGLVIDQHTFKQTPAGQATAHGLTFSHMLKVVSWNELFEEFQAFGGKAEDFFSILYHLMRSSSFELWPIIWHQILTGTFLGLYQGQRRCQYDQQ